MAGEEEDQFPPLFELALPVGHQGERPAGKRLYGSRAGVLTQQSLGSVDLGGEKKNHIFILTDLRLKFCISLMRLGNKLHR